MATSPTRRTRSKPRQFTIRLSFPPSVNHYWRHFRGMTVISTGGKSFRTGVQGDVWREYGVDFEPLLGRLAVFLEFTMPDKKRRDIDNLPKALLDALQHAGVYKDDSQIDQLIVTRLHVEPPGCVDVTIQEL